MIRRSTLWRTACAALFAVALLATVGGVSGCGSAEAKPLDVTYYYLPG